jgi:hypothetical protein
MTNTDFDFLVGRWTSRQRRLVKALAGCDEWYEFDATFDAQTYLDSNGFVDVLRAPQRDLEGRWASEKTGGRLENPVVGRFNGTVGTFECDDTWEGTPIRVRYTWSHVDTANPQWEQAFSTDGGQTWDPNWTATFHRASG